MLNTGLVGLVIDLPRHELEGSPPRPFNIVASNVDILLEIKPEGKVSWASLAFIHASHSGRVGGNRHHSRRHGYQRSRHFFRWVTIDILEPDNLS